MAELVKILRDVKFETKGRLPYSVAGINTNSQEVGKESLFVAIRGINVDGHTYLKDCEKKGAAVALVEYYSNDINIPQIKVVNSRKALSQIAANFYGNPSKDIIVVGITGTNGKTTITYLLNKILKEAGVSRGTIGTFGYSINDEEFKTNLTTPDIIQLQQIFSDMRNNKIKIVIMEVSSHAIALNRTDNVSFNGAAFTNISRDHLDFHNNLEEYAEMKSRLFQMIPESGFSVINMTDKYSELFTNKSKCPVYTTSLNNNSNYKYLSDVSFCNGISGTVSTPYKEFQIQSQLSGEYNLKNILTAVAIADNLKIGSDIIQKALFNTKMVPGRLQEESVPGYPRIFVDYAHTPDAVINVLQALRNIVQNKGQLIVVFGCGGNRDKIKRPMMAEAAEKIADFCILTSDNPRFEKPEDIIEDIRKGFKNKSKYEVVSDRKKAIEKALKNYNENDIIAILGKGHENYQEICGKKHQFDDVQIVKEFINENK